MPTPYYLGKINKWAQLTFLYVSGAIASPTFPGTYIETGIGQDITLYLKYPVGLDACRMTF